MKRLGLSIGPSATGSKTRRGLTRTIGPVAQTRGVGPLKKGTR